MSAQQPTDQRRDDDAAETAHASAAEAAASESSTEEAALREEESEIAADYLEELLDIADLDGDIEIEVHQNRTFLSVVAEGEQAEDLKMLVGKHGEVLDSLQELVRLSVLAATGNRSRLILDIAGHRERRKGELRRLAEEAVASVRESGKDRHLQPLSPYERKLVHDFVAELGFLSASEGEGPKRHIVVTGPREAAEDAASVAGADAADAAGGATGGVPGAPGAVPQHPDPAEVTVDFTAPGEEPA
ncbi:spoIIIJ-associated protein [Kocuria sp. AG109]|nr:RNA-binding protein [Rothia kristinae]TDP53584.1 spoIIIJ-associated protein [Kocuria sp. AG109]SIL81971.1 protein similar to JAG protein [Mycobacteroides abscessus subsp. abscessus]